MAISKIKITRMKTSESMLVNILIFSAKPGMLIGKDSVTLEQIKKGVRKIAPDKNIRISVQEISKPDLDAQLVAEKIAAELEKRVSYRRVMKRAMSTTRKAGARGVKIMVSGRLDGAEIARSEYYSEGSIPLQTLRADIDYGLAEAQTTFGILGVKVWIFKGEVLSNKMNEEGGQM